MKEKIKENKVLVIYILVITIILSAYLTVVSLSKNDEISPIYDKVYLGDIEKKCPYYEPDGNTWRGCLSDLLYNQKISLNLQFAKLISSLAEVNLNLKGISGEIEYVMDALNKYKQYWDSYIDIKCDLDTVGSIMGSAHPGDVSICLIKEIQSFSKKLDEIDVRYLQTNNAGKGF